MYFGGADEVTQIKELIRRMIASNVNTCMPGIIDSFNSANQTVTVRPAIQMKITINNEITYKDYPQIINVPLVFPQAGGFAITFPVQSGDQCLLIFSQRCIDNWQLSGRISPPEQNIPGARTHDITDAFAILAPSCNSNIIGDYNTNGVEIRNEIGTSKITLTDSGIVITGDLTVIGEITSTENITDKVTSMEANRFNFNGHTHNNGAGGTTGFPIQQETT